MREELNVKNVVFNDKNKQFTDKEHMVGTADGSVFIDVNITPELKREGMMREVIRHVQAARKAAGLNVDDRITLHLETPDDELAKAIHEHLGAIKSETLTATYGKLSKDAFTQAVTVDGIQLTVVLAKV